MSDDPFRPLGGAGAKPKREAEWTVVAPVPTDAPEAPKQHPSLGIPTQVWTYASPDGVLGYVHRFDGSDGKSFRPLCLFRGKSGKLEWRWESWPEPRPLYGLEHLSARPAGDVLVCEGEKSADAAAQLTGLVAVTSPSGAKSASKANWQPLSGRDVVIWPDADEPGEKYAETVANLLTLARARSVRVIAPPDGVAAGWDAADALDEGWTAERALQLVGEAAPAGRGGKRKAGRPKADGDGDKRPRQRDTLIASAEAALYWHSPAGVAFASVPTDKGHFEHYRLESQAFKRWLAGRYYDESGTVPAGQLLNDALRVLELKAIKGPEHAPAMRTAWHDGANWLDLCDDTWRAVKITADGWEVVRDPPVRFIRTETMKPLPEPEAGGLIETFRGFVNAEEPDFRLIVAWLIAALWGRATAYPVLALGGEQGSGKTTMARLLRSIVDPSAVPAIAMPRDERDLVAMAMSGHVLSFDNVSRVDAWFSDSICRLSTGNGFLARKLHTDGEAFFFQGSRPCILNGIPALTDRADLADRAITVQLLTIGEDGRQSEREWWLSWDKALPGILGALLDALVRAVRTIDDVKLTRMPRMADFATLMAAAEPALGWEPGTFEQAYDDNRSATAEAAFEADPVAMAVVDLMKDRQPGSMWEGTVSFLLVELNMLVNEDIRRSKSWPVKANALGSALTRSAPALRRKGIEISARHTGNQRLKTITRKF